MTTSEPAPDTPKGGSHRKHTHEERERLQPKLDLSGVSIPKFDFKIPSVLTTGGFAKVAAAAAQISSFSIPEYTLQSLSYVADQRSKLLASLKPVIDTQSRLKLQLDRINADLIKANTVSQTQFARLGANLEKTIDLGIGESVSKVAQQFAAQQTAWLKTLEPTLERLRKSFYPPNLRGIEDLAFEEVEMVVMADGIALYGVPRASTAKTLIRADGVSRRREVLGRRWKAISADCRKAVDGLASDTVAPYVPFAIAALDALDNNHTEVAQALTGSLIDSLLTEYFGTDRRRYTPARNGKRTTEAYDEFTIHQFIAFAPMWRVYQQYRVQDGDRIPNTFSRNATAHTVSARQFNRRNAIQALLFATSLLFFFEEQASRRQES